MKASDVMTRDVVTVGPDTPVRDIAALMTAKRISGVPVVADDGRLAGILSETDLLHRAETGTERQRKWWLGIFADADSLARDYAKAHGLRARDVMSAAVVTVDADAELRVVADVLDRRNLKRLPVLSDGKLVGIITQGDLVRALAGATPTTADVEIDDQALAETIARRMRAAHWLDSNIVNVAVEGGVVKLAGLVASPDQRRALRVLAEETPGVVRVEDKLGIRPFGLAV